MARLIKKYKNRRLYDTQKSQYITVENLQQYVIDRIDFKVEDATSGNDLTNATLLQIFVEMESGTTQFLSAEMLRQLITWAHHPMNQAFKNTLNQLFAGVENTLQANPVLEKTTETLNQQMEQFMKQWQGLFK